MFIFGKLAPLINIAVTLVLFALCIMLQKIDRRKFVYAMILATLYGCASLCLLWRGVFTGTLSRAERLALIPAIPVMGSVDEEEDKEAVEFMVIIESDGNLFNVAPGDELQIKKNLRFRINEVKVLNGDGDNLKADFKGFAGSVGVNDGQDIGYWITYDKIMPHWAIDGTKDRFEILVKDDRKILGNIYMQFID